MKLTLKTTVVLLVTSVLFFFGCKNSSSDPVAIVPTPGVTEPQAEPQPGTYVTYSKISSGSNSVCGISTTGALKCWGFNNFGQIGDGSTSDRNIPTLVNMGTNYSSVSAGGALRGFACGITTAGVLKCWGNNLYGQLGDASITDRYTPTIIDAGTNYSTVSSGGQHTCGITTGGVLKCWGDNTNGQIGDGTTTQRNTPTIINAGTNYLKVATGLNHTCGVTTAGVLKCWGGNNYGQIGNATTTQQNSPVIINAGTNYGSISAGGFFTCGITSLSILHCWGDNSSRQLADFSTGHFVPTVTDSGTNYSNISIGNNSATVCGLAISGALKCWGYNSTGLVGNGTTTNPWVTPFIVNAGVSYVESATGGSSCGITGAGALKCWGDNYFGQVGDGTTVRKLYPVLVDGI